MGFLTDFIKNAFSSEEKIRKLLNESTEHPIKKDLTFPSQKNTQTRKSTLNSTPVKRLDSEYSIPLNEMSNIQTAILIDCLNGRSKNEPLSLYFQELIGGNIPSNISKAYEDGYLRDSNTKESLEMLTIPILKDILRASNKKLGGKKNDLVIRIFTEIPSSRYEKHLTLCYKLTEKGKALVDSYYAYITNRRNELSEITPQEIYRYTIQLNCQPTASNTPKIFAYITSKHIERNSFAQKWSSVECNYLNLSRYFHDLGMDDKSLDYMLLAMALMLSGMANGNHVQAYDRVRIYSGYVNILSKLIIQLGITHYDLMKRIDDVVAPVVKNLPFSYFDVPGIKVIIADCLEGKWSDTISQFSIYDQYKKRPSTSSSRYHYYEY